MHSDLSVLLMPAMSLMLRLTALCSQTPRLSLDGSGPCRMPCAT
jgi:hypothetical protein